MVLVMAAKKSGSSKAGTGDGRGKHRNPKSLANLNREGRQLAYEGEEKKRHNVSVTDKGWEGFSQIAARIGRSNSDLIEAQGRGELDLMMTIEQLCGTETLKKLDLTPAQLMQLPIIEVLHRLSRVQQSPSDIIGGSA